MQRLAASLTVLLFLFPTLSPLAVRADDSAPEKVNVSPADWPWWRGPARNGVAPADQDPPLKWSPSENVLWKAPIPGKGHGSMIVVGDQVFLATADHERQVQSLLCLDRQTGKHLWQEDLHQGKFETRGNVKSSLASSTPACDGQRVFINFLHDGAIWTSAVSRDGKRLWQKKITDYVLHQGFGSSPAIYESLVIVSADNKGAGVISGLNRATGDIVWTHERPKFPNYTSPVILNVAGRDQLLFTGCNLVTSLDPLTGKVEWETEGSTTECVTSTVTDGSLIFTSGGYPKNHLAAVHADGSKKLAWENTSRVYVPSMLVKEGYLYTVLDAGVAMCWKCDTGKEQWSSRLGGTFSASPVMVGDRVYATNEDGRTYVFKADPKRYASLGRNDLDGEVFATPVICGSQIYVRLAKQEGGRRQEYLYCLGAK